MFFYRGERIPKDLLSWFSSGTREALPTDTEEYTSFEPMKPIRVNGVRITDSLDLRGGDK